MYNFITTIRTTNRRPFFHRAQFTDLIARGVKMIGDFMLLKYKRLDYYARFAQRIKLHLTLFMRKSSAKAHTLKILQMRQMTILGCAKWRHFRRSV